MGLQITCARAKPHSESTWSFFKALSVSNLIFLPSICLVFGLDHSCSALTYGCCLQSLAPWHVLASLFTASSSLRTSLAHHNTLGPNCKIPPKIRLKKNSWNCLIILLSCSSLTNFEYEVNEITGNGNDLNLLKLFWKNAWNHFRWTYSLRIWAITYVCSSLTNFEHSWMKWNDRKRKWFKSAEICWEKFVKPLQVNLFLTGLGHL